MSKMTALFRKALSVILMVTVGSSYCLITSTAFAQVSPKLAGQLSVRGQVTFNGINAISGATIFSGSQVKTEADGSAIISLGRMGQIDLGPNTELTLRLDAGMIGGHLRSGYATISAATGVGINLATADGIAVANGNQSSVLTVDMTSGNTRVASIRSEVRVTTGNQIEIIAAGQEVSVGTQTNQKGTPCECYDRNGKKTGDGKFNDRGICECKDQPAAGVLLGAGGISAGALATLLIVGVGGALAGILTSLDNKVAGETVVLSNFR